MAGKCLDKETILRKRLDKTKFLVREPVRTGILVSVGSKRCTAKYIMPDSSIVHQRRRISRQDCRADPETLPAQILD